MEFHPHDGRNHAILHATKKDRANEASPSGWCFSFTRLALSRILYEPRILCTPTDHELEQCTDGPISSVDNLVDFTRYGVIAPRTLWTGGLHWILCFP